MNLDIQRIFPTSVIIFDNVLEQEYIDSMKDDIISQSKINAEKRQFNWQSEKNLILVTHYVVILEKLNKAVSSGEIVVQGGTTEFLKFLAIFR